MIVVTVELISAVTGEQKVLGRTVIANDGTASGRVGNYTAHVGRKGSLDPVQCLEKPLRTGRVEGYPRLSYNVWRLVIRALRSAFPEEDK